MKAAQWYTFIIFSKAKILFFTEEILADHIQHFHSELFIENPIFAQNL